MKLYTRLIEEGIFIFWNSDEGNTSYNLKIRIAVGDDKVELVHLDMPKGQNYYSFDKIGSGDYEIELNGFKDNRLYQTESKKIKIVSSVQKEQEQADKILDCLSDMQKELTVINKALTLINKNLIYCLEPIEDVLTDPEKICDLRYRVHRYEKTNYRYDELYY